MDKKLERRNRERLDRKNSILVDQLWRDEIAVAGLEKVVMESYLLALDGLMAKVKP